MMADTGRCISENDVRYHHGGNEARHAESDTGEKIKAIVGLVKALQPAVRLRNRGPDNPESARLREDLKASMNLIAQMRDQEMQTLRREIQELRTSSTTIQTTAAGVAT